MPVPLIAAGAQVVEGIANIFGSHKTTLQKAQEFVQANEAEIQAGNNAYGKGLNALQYRLTTLGGDPVWRPVLLGELAYVVNRGWAKASDFNAGDVAAAGVVGNTYSAPAPINSTGGVNVAPANNALNTMAQGKGVSLVTLGIILLLAAAAWWFFTRK
jgi:hypothetical protein